MRGGACLDRSGRRPAAPSGVQQVEGDRCAAPVRRGRAVDPHDGAAVRVPQRRQRSSSQPVRQRTRVWIVSMPIASRWRRPMLDRRQREVVRGCRPRTRPRRRPVRASRPHAARPRWCRRRTRDGAAGQAPACGRAGSRRRSGSRRACRSEIGDEVRHASGRGRAGSSARKRRRPAARPSRRPAPRRSTPADAGRRRSWTGPGRRRGVPCRRSAGAGSASSWSSSTRRSGGVLGT